MNTRRNRQRCDGATVGQGTGAKVRRWDREPVGVEVTRLRRHGRCDGAGRAFTLLELLVVIAIIGLLAASSMPAIRALTQTNTVAAGHRQFLDDLSLARYQAISGRRTVYVVLVPPTMRAHFQTVQTANSQLYSPQAKTAALRSLTNLVNGQYTAYALFTRRTVGDQPGRERPAYLGEWRQLPDGMIFGTNLFSDLGSGWLTVANHTNVTDRPLPYGWFPFPTAESPEARLPYLAFDSTGRMVYEGGVVPRRPGESIPLLRASVFYPKDNQNRYALNSPPDVVITEQAGTNRMDVRVDWLTGRARVIRPWEQNAAWQ
ncbi:MAG: prepilin-type N-terminal cleavage/methylation domain-containing protein [Verrucomicrobia bacterium]|nr:prepilin-type N-terminal cleavage/methylation domain-containing protein [Verrucomicrobiota bacterium]